MNEGVKVETFDYALRNNDNHQEEGKRRKRYILLLLLLFSFGYYFFNKNSIREMIGLLVRDAEGDRKKQMIGLLVRDAEGDRKKQMIGLLVRDAEGDRKKHRPLNIKRKGLKSPRRHTSKNQAEDSKNTGEISCAESPKILGSPSKNEKLIQNKDENDHCVDEKEALIFDQGILISLEPLDDGISADGNVIEEDLISLEPLDDGISADEDTKPGTGVPKIICGQSQMDGILKTETAEFKENNKPAITPVDQVEKLDGLTIEDKLNYIDLNFSFGSFIKNPKAVKDDLEKRKVFKITVVPTSIVNFLKETGKNKDDKQSIFAKMVGFGRNLYNYSLNGGGVSRKKIRRDFKIWKSEIKEKIKRGISEIYPSHKDARAIDEFISPFMDSVAGKYIMGKNEQGCSQNPAGIKTDEHEPDNVEYCYDRGHISK